MAEFCLKHFNEMFDEELMEKDVVLEEEFCEGCGEMKPCVIALRRKSIFSKLFEKLSNRKK